MHRQVVEIQRLYPQVYLACHVDHVRAVSTTWRLSSKDASILAHLDRDVASSPGELAQHLGIGGPALSAALLRLTRLGYITSTPLANDRRRRELRLTERGAEAMASTSVLDASRVEELLAKLSDPEREAALHGLSLLARAARAMKEEA